MIGYYMCAKFVRVKCLSANATRDEEENRKMNGITRAGCVKFREWEREMDNFEAKYGERLFNDHVLCSF